MFRLFEDSMVSVAIKHTSVAMKATIHMLSWVVSLDYVLATFYG